MKVFLIKAYADTEYGLKEQKTFIKAESREEAKRVAWEKFPEYHQVGVFEQEAEI